MARPSELPEWATDGDNLLEPSSGKKAAGWFAGEQPPAQYFNWWKRLVWQWLAYLDAEKLLDVERLIASSAVIASGNTAHDQPGNATNKWKLFSQWKLHTNTFVRLYSGDESASPGGHWAITWNAVWGVASGEQYWSKDDAGKAAFALISDGGGLNWRQRDGAGTWTTGWTSAVGNLSVGGDVNVGDDLTVTDDAAIGGDLTVTGTAAAASLGVAGTATVIDVDGGTMRVNGQLDVNGDLFASDDVIAGNEFQYGTPPTRTVLLPLFRGFGEGVLDSTGTGPHVLLASAGQVHLWPIEVPTGATLVSVDALVDKPGTGNTVLSVHVQQGQTWSPTPSLGGVGDIASDTEAAAGSKMLSVSVPGGFSAVNNASNQFYVHITSGDAGDRVHALRATFVDPGPRSH